MRFGMFFVLQSLSFVSAFAFSTEALEVLESGNFALLVTKQSNELAIRPLTDFQKTVHSYRAISGTNAGDKFAEGDEKTPEGVYFVTRKIPQSLMTKLHGAVAFGLNYPNSLDRFEKKTGYGIWIHGVDSDDRMEKRFDTKGCVALANGEVSELGKFLKNDTPVVIVDSKDEASKVKLEYKTGALVDEVKAWAAAWSSRELEPYMEFYHADFIGKDGMNRKQWRDYKGQLVKAYSKIDVSLDNILVVDHPKYRYAVFEQEYASNRFKASGKKRLFWKKSEDGKYRIVLEEGFRQQTGYIN